MIASGFGSLLNQQHAAQMQALRNQQFARLAQSPYAMDLVRSGNALLDYATAAQREEMQKRKDIKRLFIAFGADDAVYHSGQMRPVYLRESTIPKIKRGAA